MFRKILILLIGLLGPLFWISLDMGLRWTALQRYYFPAYFSSYTSAREGRYTFLYVLDPNGWRIALDPDVVRAGPIPGSQQSGLPFALSERARRLGAKRLEWRVYPQIESATALGWLRQPIYQGKTPFNLIRLPVIFGSVFIFGLFPLALWRGRQATREAMAGQILRGPRFVTCTRFNALKHSDGLGFEIIERLTGLHRLFPATSPHPVLRIPRYEENSHLVLIGDTGTGKSSLIRQILLQVRDRGESAIVYDPALEFTPQFYDPTHDVILNPTDKRMPYWAPSDEVQYPAEALALAGSLFPDKPRDNTFFTEASRKIFAHLLRYRPTPQDLTEWMKNMDELDRRVAGTELEAMISKNAGGQRAAVQGTFNQGAAAFQLLPSEQEAQGRWSAAAWGKQRKGWIFLPSSPTLRESLRPLLSMWLDSLILRLMESAQNEPSRVWFVMDELSSLQRLPQLPTAITEGRKSNICLVIGFQGRSQLETLYGHQAEAMLSQPMTKVFFRTSEPNAAEWVSRSIGEVEVMRLEETHSQSIPAFLGHRGKSSRMQRHMEPLVMASTIEGLHNLTAYVKSRDLVVPTSFPYLMPQPKQPAFVPRALPELELLALPRSPAGAARSAPTKQDIEEKHNAEHSREGSAELEIFD
jgi:hypothetical protein